MSAITLLLERIVRFYVSKLLYSKEDGVFFFVFKTVGANLVLMNDAVCGTQDVVL